jgi:hypothetical protein
MLRCDVHCEESLVKVPLQKGRSHPVVLGELNGKKLRWILDTGSTLPVIMDAQSAVQAGVKTIESSKLHVEGAVGSAEGLVGWFGELTLGGKMRLGPGHAGILLGNYRATWAGIPVRRLPMNLIGLPVLECFSSVTLDRGAGELVLLEKGRFNPRSGAVWVPFTREDGKLWVDLSIDGRHVRAFLDTGASDELGLSPAAFQGISEKNFAVPHGKISDSLGVGGVEPQEGGVLNEVALGGLRLKRLKYSTRPKKKESVLGWGALSRGPMTLDFARNRLWLDRVD